MPKYYVYTYSDPRNMQPFYVGKGTGYRIYVHLTETKENTCNYKKWAFIKGLLNKGLEPIIAKVAEFDDEQEAYDYEENLIRTLGRKDIDEGGTLTNICSNNRPPNPLGRKVTEETRIKISLAHTGKEGKPWSEERKIAFSRLMAGDNNPMSGRTIYDVWIEKYGQEEADKRMLKWLANRKTAGMAGRTHSVETKKKMSASSKDKPKSSSHKAALAQSIRGRIWIKCISTGETKQIRPEEFSSFDPIIWTKGRK